VTEERLERPFALEALYRVGVLLQRLPRGFWWLVAVAWMAGIAWLSSLSSAELPPSPLGAFGANLMHAFLFGLLGFWVALGIPRAGGWPRLVGSARFLVFLVVVGYGVIDEWRQASTPGREPSGYDVLTDFVGAWCVLWIVGYVPRASASHVGLAARFAACLALCAAAAGMATVAG
jgi:VanZ family protein